MSRKPVIPESAQRLSGIQEATSFHFLDSRLRGNDGGKGPVFSRQERQAAKEFSSASTETRAHHSGYSTPPNAPGEFISPERKFRKLTLSNKNKKIPPRLIFVIPDAIRNPESPRKRKFNQLHSGDQDQVVLFRGGYIANRRLFQDGPRSLEVIPGILSFLFFAEK